MKVLELTIRRFEARCLRLRLAILLVFYATATFSLVAPTGALAQTATWRETVGTLRIGFVTTGNDEVARRRMEPFRRALARTTGLNVVLSPVASLAQLINLQANRRLQYAIHSASSYVTLDQACKCVEAVAVPRDQEGALGVFAVLLAPRDGTVRSLSDLKGRVLAIPREPATTTRTVPLAQLAVQGFGEPGALGTLRDVDNPVDGWRLVLNGEADAVMGWSSLQGEASTGYSLGTLNHLIEQTGLAERDDIRVVWTSRIVPHGPHVIRADLPTELKETIKRFLLDLKNTDILAYDAVEPHLSGGFSEIGPNDFIALTRVVTGQGQ